MLDELRHTAFRTLRDIGLFLRSARSDARLATLRKGSMACAAAFDRLYTDVPQNDRWACSAAKYQ